MRRRNNKSSVLIVVVLIGAVVLFWDKIKAVISPPAVPATGPILGGTGMTGTKPSTLGIIGAVAGTLADLFTSLKPLFGGSGTSTAGTTTTVDQGTGADQPGGYDPWLGNEW